jgi:hypothetical protein
MPYVKRRMRSCFSDAGRDERFAGPCRRAGRAQIGCRGHTSAAYGRHPPISPPRSVWGTPRYAVLTCPHCSSIFLTATPHRPTLTAWGRLSVPWPRTCPFPCLHGHQHRLLKQTRRSQLASAWMATWPRLGWATTGAPCLPCQRHFLQSSLQHWRPATPSPSARHPRPSTRPQARPFPSPRGAP